MSNHETKSYRASYKAIGGADRGIVEAIVSVFGNIDLGGDRIMPGAFKNSLDRWQNSGDPMPFIWSHEWDNPEAHIGYVEAAEERPEGLWVRAKIDIDRPFAEQVFHLMKTRRVTQFSFGYTVQDSKLVKDADGTEVRELIGVDIFEAGPTLLGMNPATQLLEAASALRAQANKPANASKSIDESNYPVTPRQIAVYDALENIVEIHGKFDQSTGSEGAHYVAPSPFAGEGMVCSNCVFFEGPRGCEIVNGDIAPEAVCKLWTIPNDLITSAAPAEQASKAINQDHAQTKAIDVPEYVAANAKRGLDYLEQGYGGDGLENATIADARDLAAGSTTEEKVAKIGPWIDRHIVDLDAPKNSDPQDPEYPGPGLVAMLLWGAGPDKEGAMRTRDWARQETESLQPEQNSKSDQELETAERDSTANIIPEEIVDLLTRTRHSEE